MTLFDRIRNAGLELLWSLRPKDSRNREEDLLRLIQRFPNWIGGRKRLAEESLAHEHIARAYAEALALQTLAGPRLELLGESYLLLGRCFLKKSDVLAARHYLTEAEQLLPTDPRVKEELAATYTFSGDKESALKILKKVAVEKLTPEGKAVLQWLTLSDKQPR